jgi:hypothetical protein
MTKVSFPLLLFNKREKFSYNQIKGKPMPKSNSFSEFDENTLVIFNYSILLSLVASISVLGYSLLSKMANQPYKNQ